MCRSSGRTQIKSIPVRIVFPASSAVSPDAMYVAARKAGVIDNSLKFKMLWERIMNERQVVIPCPQCRSKNRVALDRVNQKPKCGKCGAALSIPAFDKPVNVTDATFNREVFASSLPVLVDCWAPWCGPCRMVGPILDELAGTYRGQLKIVKLNVDENPRTASQYSISSIPTLLLVKNGQVVDTQVGAPSKNALIQRIERLLAS